MFSVILVAGLLAGVVLVVVLMTLNLTVAIGTLNGIIFYANVLGATSGTGLSNRIPSILISWLNLEIGLDVCFFEGMDMYWKTWLQLAFPSYVILLVVLIVIVSEHSVKFSQLLARKNPVATLDTLILLSYTTLLQTAITALSLAKLEYPDGSSQWVWLADGNVHYGRGKHIALIVVAILILMLGVAYTSLLFFWQWIVPRQDKLLFKWARSQQLCHFLEPYHAPYNFEHRYWTGLLLLVRVILSLVFSLNVSGDQGINLLAITLLVGALLFLRAQTGRLYKRKIIDWFEMICYLNVGLFSVIKLYLLKADNVTANSVIEYISVLITLILIMAVMLAHMWTEVCLKCFKCAPQRIKDDDDQRYPSEIDANAGQADQPTYSVIERPCLPTNTQELKDPVSKSSIPCCPNDGGDDKNEFEDAVDSSTSSESLTTLLIKCHKN